MRPADPPPPGPIVVRLPNGRVVQQSDAFHIGRDAGCDVQVSEVQVSRRHAEVSPHGGQWTVRDLQSSNGLFVEGERVEEAPVGAGINVTLGAGGPTVFIGPASSARPAPPPPAPVPPARPAEGSESLEDYAQRYFGTDDDDESVGGHTLMIRKAFQKVQGQQRRRQRWTIALVLMLAVAVAAYALREHQLVAKQEQLAEGIFYTMKSQDVRFAQLEQKTASSGNTPSQQEIAAYVEEQRQLESHYEEYAARLYDRKLNERDRLILKVTRTFGECELAAPPEYSPRGQPLHPEMAADRPVCARGQVLAGPWLSPAHRQRLSCPAPAAAVLLPRVAGKQLRRVHQRTPDPLGDRKGMWQFIPETGAKYGLRIGPRASVSGADALDDRFNWEKATDAASRYIKDIYATDAQASGLLVIASYNWGEHRIIDILRTMPADPRERNFWRSSPSTKCRMQTYDYVFNIVSAAVIGENPRLFGFDFDSPLKFIDQH